MAAKESPVAVKFGLILPDKLNKKPYHTPEKAVLLTKIVTLGILRLLYFIVSNIFATIYYFTLVALLEPLRYMAEPLYWYGVGRVFKWLQLIVGFWMWSAGYKVEVCGDDISDIDDEETLVLANHQSTADVPALMYAFQFTGRVLQNVLWVMDVMFKRTDFGLVSMHRGDFFIKAGKATRHLQDELFREHLQNIYLTRGREWVVVFPEGGFFWKQKASSQAYGKKNGFPHLEHCLLPRAGAVHTVLETLNGTEASPSPHLGRKIKWILDVTVAYPNAKPLNFQTIVFGQRDDMNVTLHYRKIPISEVPVGNSEVIRDWLFEMYKEKDKMLDYFYKYGSFPVPEEEEEEEGGDEVVKKKDKNKYINPPQVLDFTYSRMALTNIGFTCVTFFAVYTSWTLLQASMGFIW